MNFPVSVIIPVYNAALSLEMAVASVVNLIEVEEIILVEDGSTDQSLAICKNLAETSDRIKVFVHPVNRGASAARNLGISKSTCPFIAFLDADDIFLPNRFQTARFVFENQPEADGVYEAIGTLAGQNDTDKPNITTVQEIFKPEELFYKISPVGNQGYFSIIGFTARREVFTQWGHFNENLRIAEDTEFFLRLTAAAHLLPGELRYPVAMRRIRPGNRPMDDIRIRIQKPLMALEALKWFRDHQMPFRMSEEILRVYLKYRYELEAAQKSSNRFSRKVDQIAEVLQLWRDFPDLRKSDYLKYHLRLTLKLPVKKHLNLYAPAES